MLKITNFSASINQKPILTAINLEIPSGKVHVLMGPNGSGKSTLAHGIMGHPAYEITSGSLVFNGIDITALPINKRAQAGLFLAFQNPIEIPGITVFDFLKEAYFAITQKIMSPKEFQQFLFTQMDILAMDYAFAYRNLNEGFSGGEKKRLEILQMLVLNPTLAILDEIDSGLDVDAIKNVATGLQAAKSANPSMSILIITHYPRLLAYIHPDQVHVMHSGTIIRQGQAQLAHMIEQGGYDAIR